MPVMLTACCAYSTSKHFDIGSVQVAKNIVLAGCGRLTLIDDAPCSSAPTSNFLVPASAEPTARWDTVPADRGMDRKRVSPASPSSDAKCSRAHMHPQVEEY